MGPRPSMKELGPTKASHVKRLWFYRTVQRLCSPLLSKARVTGWSHQTLSTPIPSPNAGQVPSEQLTVFSQSWRLEVWNLVSGAIAMLKHHEQSNSRRKGLIWLTRSHAFHHWRTWERELRQGRKLKARADAEAMARADAEAMEGWCLLVCSPWLAQPTFL